MAWRLSERKAGVIRKLNFKLLLLDSSQRCHSPPKSGRSPPKSCLGGDLGGFLGGVGGDLGGGFGRIYFI